MREIKFRCWDGTKMISPDYINRDGTAIWYENSIPEKSNIVMMWTGLRDKNGKEIYEGDVLSFDDEHLVIKPLGVVTFHEGRFELYHAVKGWSGIQLKNRNGKVIGNIHESPELLSQAKGKERRVT